MMNSFVSIFGTLARSKSHDVMPMFKWLKNPGVSPASDPGGLWLVDAWIDTRKWAKMRPLMCHINKDICAKDVGYH